MPKYLLFVLILVLSACLPQPEPLAESDPVPPPDNNSAPAPKSDTDAPAADEPGGIFIHASSADASTLNPILSTDSASTDVIQRLLPSLLGLDPIDGVYVPTDMAESWETSPDGLVWTFHLRDNVFWSDGEQVNADDFKFTYDAIGSDLVESPRKSNIAQVESIEVLDPLTIQITFKQVKCDALADLDLHWMPSHLYAPDFSDVMTGEQNTNLGASAGPLTFRNWAVDDQITLVRNDDYWKGAPLLEGWVYKTVPDPGARLGQLQSGEVSFIEVQPEQLTLVELDPNLSVYNYKDDGYDYLALNQANPENPMSGQDEEGNLVEQDPHPILSDKQVRLAIAHALDYDTIIENVYLGQGYQIASNVLPAIPWAHNDSLQPYDFDQAKASQLLEDAGWIDSDGDGIREKDGLPLALTLVTNAGNTTREDLSILIQDQLNSIGFDITFEAVEFGALVGQLLGQQFDMVVIGWTGLGNDPNDDGFWHSRFDDPEGGFNFASYQNSEVDRLLEEAVSIPGCAIEERAPLYKEIQQLIYDDAPFVFISGGVDNLGYSKKWHNIDPGPWSFYHNIEQFAFSE